MAQEITFPEIVEQEVMWGLQGGIHKAKKYKALVDSKTGKVFSIVSKGYKLIRHEGAIEQVEEAINETSALGKYETYTDFYNDGGRMFRTYRFPEISFEIEPKDYIHPELHLVNSYDTIWPFMVILGAFRVVCENGLVVHKELFQVKKRHVYELENLYLKEEVSSALWRFSLQIEQWKKWAKRQLTIKTHDQVMEAMEFGQAATLEINKRIEREAKGFDENGLPIMSLWIFFNVLTWYVTHRAVSLNHRVELEKSLRAAMASLKRK